MGEEGEKTSQRPEASAFAMRGDATCRLRLAAEAFGGWRGGGGRRGVHEGGAHREADNNKLAKQREMSDSYLRGCAPLESTQALPSEPSEPCPDSWLLLSVKVAPRAAVLGGSQGSGARGLLRGGRQPAARLTRICQSAWAGLTTQR